MARVRIPAITALLLLLHQGPSVVLAQRTIIPTTSFDSQADFDADWNYLYPWGTDHNGGARMDEAHVALSSGTLALTAEPVTGQGPASSGGKSIPVNYLSGAIHAKEHFTVQSAAGSGYDFSGEFQATTDRGTWPAFWLTGVDSWPPEIDMAEWKGSGKISFNTFNTSSQVDARDIDYPNPGEFHTIRCQVREHNGVDVQIKYFLDGTEVTTQYGKDFVGKAFYLIINLQMEGSSGSPGPTDNITYSVRNLEVLSYNP